MSVEADFRKAQTSMKAYRDIKNSLATKWAEGHETGREEGLKEGRGEYESVLIGK